MERAELKRRVLELPGAVERGAFVFLADPNWGEAESKHFAAITADVASTPEAEGGRGWLCIPTGGTSGRLRFSRHDEATLGAAVAGFCSHFGVSTVNAVGVLPLHHVSGLMGLLRTSWTGGAHLSWDWRKLAAGDFPAVKGGGGDWFLSVVPTQLQRLLQLPAGVEFLRGFRAVFVGGGPSWAALVDQAMSAKVPVVLSYGMTETAAMIAAQLPADFAAGARNVGRAMPHVRLDLLDEEGLSGDGAREVGRIRVAGRSVHLGYFPAFDLRQELVTEDLGRFEAGGALQVLGRRDALIISGGEKISPAEVEEALRSLGVFADIAVIGVPDPVWGQAVVACHPASGGEKAPALEDVRAALGERLAAFKQPKHLVAVAEWPRNAQGKLNRTALLNQALLALGRR